MKISMKRRSFSERKIDKISPTIFSKKAHGAIRIFICFCADGCAVGYLIQDESDLKIAPIYQFLKFL